MATITTKIIAGDYPQAVRQYTTTQFTGVAPVGPAPDSKLYLPLSYTGGRYDYVDPKDYTLNNLADGGLFDFENEDLPIAITEIRGQTSAYTVFIEDKDGTNSVAIATAIAAGTRVEFHPPAIVLPSQRVKVTTPGAATVDVYVVKGNCRTA